MNFIYCDSDGDREISRKNYKNSLKRAKEFERRRRQEVRKMREEEIMSRDIQIRMKIEDETKSKNKTLKDIVKSIEVVVIAKKRIAAHERNRFARIEKKEIDEANRVKACRVSGGFAFKSTPNTFSRKATVGTFDGLTNPYMGMSIDISISNDSCLEKIANALVIIGERLERLERRTAK